MYAGLDVGSRTIKLVILDNAIKDSLIIESGANPLRRCQEILSGRRFERLVVTGYGRHLVAPILHGIVVSEVKAFAIGSRHLFNDCNTVIDIGGQDAKVILLSDLGEVRKFEMNDRCAAGTGKFLEVMAQTLGVGISEIGSLALGANKKIRINSLCTVFAESEVVSLIARGEEASDIAMALHEAIAIRIVTMACRVGVKKRVIFAGGAALNRCLHQLIKEKINLDLEVPPEPQMIGAIGAAILAKKTLPDNNAVKETK